MADFKNLTKADSGYVEVMTNEKTGMAFGYRLTGASAGPQLVVAGTCPSAEKVFDRLLAIPSLPWMRGNLVLIRLDALDNLLGDLSSLSPLGPVDRTLVLPLPDAKELDETLTLHSYHMVLRACAELGMISGRGVVNKPVGARDK